MSQFIREIPKCDLHVHLDGSLRVPTLIELAGESNVNLPSYTEQGMYEKVFKGTYKDLPDYLQGFSYSISVMQTPENLERVAYEFAWDNINEGVCYVEVRFAPQFHVNRYMTVEDVVASVCRGLDRAKKEYNSGVSVTGGKKPEFEYGIIACAMRAIFPGIADYFDKFMLVHSYSSASRVGALASYELVLAMIKVRDMGYPIVGCDLAGAEYGFPANDHKDAYSLAHRNFFKKTVHAGEAFGAESIFQAITDLYADRLGHGYYLFSEDMITDPQITDKKDFISKLVQYIADRRITIEVCLTSNMQTNPAIGSLENHSFKKMLEHKLSTTICTDNRTVSMTTVSRELELAINHFNLTQSQIKNCIIYGFKRSFHPGTYNEKRSYVRKIIDFYEEAERKFL
ncbi:MAG: adenosine deaminase family protein [Oligoflexia bacterium]|nr:adenosine deaminase family protein [Oligoflexia bacterium]